MVKQDGKHHLLHNGGQVFWYLARQLLVIAVIMGPIASCEQGTEIAIGTSEAVTDKMEQLKKERKERCLRLQARSEGERSDLENASLEYVNGRLGQG